MVRGSPKPAMLLLCFVAAPPLLSVGERVSTKAVIDASEGCKYPEDIGFQVGDKVRIIKPSAKINSVVTEVVCPKIEHATDGRVCVAPWSGAAEAKGGCWPPKKLRKMSALALALNALKPNAELVGRSKDGEVQQKLIDFAADTTELSGQALAAVDVCEPEARGPVQRAFAALQTLGGRYASAAAETLIYIPATLYVTANLTARAATAVAKKAARGVKEAPRVAKAALIETAEATARLIRHFGRLMDDVVTSVAENEVVQELVSKVAHGFDELNKVVQALVSKVAHGFDELVTAVMGWVMGDHPKLVRAINGFFDLVSHLSEAVVALTQFVWARAKDAHGAVVSLTQAVWSRVEDAYYAEWTQKVLKRTQKAIESIQSMAGKFLSAAALRWPPVRAAIMEFASDRLSEVKELGVKAFKAVNSCQLKVRVQLQAAFATVQNRVERLATAVVGKMSFVLVPLGKLATTMSAKIEWLATALVGQIPVVLERLRELANDMSAKIKHFATHVVRGWTAVAMRVVELAYFMSERLGELASIMSEISKFVSPYVQSAIATIRKHLAQLKEFVSHKTAESMEIAHKLAEGIKKKFAELTSKISPYVQSAKRKAQSAIVTIRKDVAQLKEIVSHKITTMEKKAHETAERIKKGIAELTSKMTHGETTTYDDSEDVADL